MTFAYLILAHKNPNQLKRLVDALATSNTVFLIHVDAKISIMPFVRCFDNYKPGLVFFCSERKLVKWGMYGMVEATVSLIHFSVKLGLNAEYYHLLSGQDYPLIGNREILDFFQKNKGKNFINYFSLPDNRWQDSFERVNYKWFLNDEGSRNYTNLDYYQKCKSLNYIPDGYSLYGGSQWWSLTKDAILYIYNLYSNKNLIFDFFRYTLVPDEMLFQTILLNSDFRRSVINNNLRFIKWTKGQVSPNVLEWYDGEELNGANLLFARKFSNSSASILDEIDNHRLCVGSFNANKKKLLPNSCVISAVGKNSLHQNWMSSGSPEFDLHLIVYDDSFDEFKNDTDLIMQSKGCKLKLVFEYLSQNHEFKNKYDYFFMPDDDILIDCTSIQRLFLIMKEYNLAIAQPALTRSFYSYEHTKEQFHSSILRYTNFVEMMLPCFSREALEKVLFTFNENHSGWGADFHWGKLVNFKNFNMAVIDDVKAVHTRPIQSGNGRNLNEFQSYIEKYNLKREIIELT